MPKPHREPVADALAKLERDVADPNVKTPIVLYVRALSSMAAEGSTGRVSATVNGFGVLKRVRIGPEMFSDLPRLGRLVKQAVNLATNEAFRRQPPMPSSLPGGRGFVPPRPPTPAHLGGAVTDAQKARWRGALPGENEAQRSAFIDAAHVIRERILRDAKQLPNELSPLLRVVHLRLGEPFLSAIAVRRAAKIDDPAWSKRFQRQAGVSLTAYIEKRQMEIAARMIYRSDLTIEEISRMFGYLNRTAILNAIGYRCCRQSPRNLRFFWEQGGLDYVLFQWASEEKATDAQFRQVIADLTRMAATIGLSLPREEV